VKAIGNERFQGLITHAGHAYAATNCQERELAADEVGQGLTSTAEICAVPGSRTEN
jgi:hypothetical protein